MSATLARWLTFASATAMVAAGLGLLRWIFPQQSELLHRLEAAGGQLLGLAGLCIIELLRQHGQLRRRAAGARPPAAADREEPHPLPP